MERSLAGVKEIKILSGLIMSICGPTEDSRLGFLLRYRSCLPASGALFMEPGMCLDKGAPMSHAKSPCRRVRADGWPTQNRDISGAVTSQLLAIHPGKPTYPSVPPKGV